MAQPAVTTLMWLATTALLLTTVTVSTGPTPECQQTREKCSCHEQGWKSFNTSSCSIDTTYLDLSSNYLLELHANMFCTLIHLKTINLNNNTIFTVDKSTFGELMELEKIYLTNNNITHLPRDLIRNNTKVTELYLKSNKILIPPCGPLLNSTSLKILNLEWCSIDTLVESEAFSHLPSLEKLELNGNSLQVMNTNPFQNLKNTKVIKNDTLECSAELKETIVQLMDHIKFTHKCNLGPNIDDRTTTEPGPESATPQVSIVIAVFLPVAVITTCLVVVVLVVYMCITQLRGHYYSKSSSQTTPRTQQDPNNDGYEIPSPQVIEEDDVFTLPFAPIPPRSSKIHYLRILSDDSPIQTPESEDDVFFNAIRPSGNRNRPELSHDASPTIQHFDTQNDNYVYEIPSPVPDGATSLDASGSSRQTVNTQAHQRKYSQQTSARETSLQLGSRTPNCSPQVPQRVEDDFGKVIIRPLPKVPSTLRDP